MPTLTELHEQRSTLVTAARERLNQIDANTDEARAAELTSQHDAAMAALDTLDASIAREERVAQAERQQNEARERREREVRDRRPVAPVLGTPEALATQNAYRDAFFSYVRHQGNVALLSDEERSVLQRGYQAVESRAQTAGTQAAGGYMVPIELQAEIIRVMKMWGPMYNADIVREIVTSGGYQLLYPTVDDTGKTSNPAAEGQTLLDDGSGDAVIGQKTLGAYSYATPWLRVSKELAEDAMSNMQAFLGDLLGERLGRGANARLTNGTGQGPTGIVPAAMVGTTSASAVGFTFDDIIKLEHSVDPAYRMSPKCTYMFNDAILQVIRLLKDGQGNYLWQHGDVKQGVPPQVNGRNYAINQAMVAATAASARVALFGDFSKYFVRKVGAPLIGAIQDKDFWPGFGMAGWIRFDGNLMDASAVKALVMAAS